MMNRYTHVSGTLYQIMDGVRRAKAAHMYGHAKITAEVVDPSGQSLGEGEIPLEALRSPKPLIRRITLADEHDRTNEFAEMLDGICRVHPTCRYILEEFQRASTPPT